MPVDTIEQQLDQWSDMAANGVPADAIFAAPDYDVYRRAFRLKRFYRCPRCDEPEIRVVRDFMHLYWDLWCGACTWRARLERRVMRDPDDEILELVRGVSPASASAARRVDRRSPGALRG